MVYHHLLSSPLNLPYSDWTPSVSCQDTMLRGIFHHPLHFRHALDGANGAGETGGIGVPGRSIQTIPGHVIDAQDLVLFLWVGLSYVLRMKMYNIYICVYYACIYIYIFICNTVCMHSKKSYIIWCLHMCFI